METEESLINSNEIDCWNLPGNTQIQQMQEMFEIAAKGKRVLQLDWNDSQAAAEVLKRADKEARAFKRIRKTLENEFVELLVNAHHAGKVTEKDILVLTKLDRRQWAEIVKKRFPQEI
jgi:hypothetical protein